MRAAYMAALEVAARESGLDKALVEAAAATDFGKWAKSERLPKLPN